MTRELVFSLKDKAWWEDDSTFSVVCVSMSSLCRALSLFTLCFMSFSLSSSKDCNAWHFSLVFFVLLRQLLFIFVSGGAWEMIVWKGCAVYIKNCNEFIVDKTYNSGIEVAFRAFLLGKPPTVICLFLREMMSVILHVWGDWPDSLIHN